MNFIHHLLKVTGEQNGVPSLEVLQNTLQMVATQIDFARRRRGKDGPILHDHKVKKNDSVMIRNRTSGAFGPNYKENYRIVKFLGKNQLQVVNTVNGRTMQVPISDVKKLDNMDKVCDQLPNYKEFGRAVKLWLNPNNIKDLG